MIAEAENNVADLRRSELELQKEINDLRAEEARRNKPPKKKAWYDPAGWRWSMNPSDLVMSW